MTTLPHSHVRQGTYLESLNFYNSLMLYICQSYYVVGDASWLQLQ